MVDRAEAVGDPVLAAVADQQHLDVAELGVAVGAALGALVGARRLGAVAPASQCASSITQGIDVLEPAEDAPAARRAGS